MPVMVLTAAYVAINGIDHSGAAKKIELGVEVEDHEVTTYASQGWKRRVGGLKDGSLSLAFLNDVGAGQVDALVWALLGSVTTFEVRASGAAVSASNPKWTGSILVNKWTPLAGEVGQVAEVEVDWPTDGAVTRATA